MNLTNQVYDVIIIGGGAAGLFCACHLPAGTKACILEKTQKLGTKILLSGGERCNCTNIRLTKNNDIAQYYTGRDPSFAAPIIEQFDSQAMITWLEKNDIKTTVEDRGRCIVASGKSLDLRDLLVRTATAHGVEIFTGAEVTNIERSNNRTIERSGNTCHVERKPMTLSFSSAEVETSLKRESMDRSPHIIDPSTPAIRGQVSSGGQINHPRFHLTISHSLSFDRSSTTDLLSTSRLIIATGGMTYPVTGSTGRGYALAQQLGIEVVEPYCGLSGIFTEESMKELAGSSVPATVDVMLPTGETIGNPCVGPVLFTHRGLSGPAIFDASLIAQQYLSPLGWGGGQIQNLKLNTQHSLRLRLSFDLKITPKKVIDHFSLSSKKKKRVVMVAEFPGTDQSTVTGGGIATSELTSSCETKKIPGLYRIGETVDITGRTGGFNLQWAWSSGYVVAKHFTKVLQ